MMNIDVYTFLVVWNDVDIKKVKKFVVWYILFPLFKVKHFHFFRSFKSACNLRGPKPKGKVLKPFYRGNKISV